MLQQGIPLFQIYNTNKLINKTWILLNSCSTETVFNNPALVTNIRTDSVDEELRMLTKRGSIIYKEVADCKLLPLKYIEYIVTKTHWRMFHLSNNFHRFLVLKLLYMHQKKIHSLYI